MLSAENYGVDHLQVSTKSIKYSINNTGPRTKHWGTQFFTISSFCIPFFHITICVIDMQYAENQVKAWPLNPKFSIFSTAVSGIECRMPFSNLGRLWCHFFLLLFPIICSLIQLQVHHLLTSDCWTQTKFHKKNLNFSKLSTILIIRIF